jgi:DNA primase
VSLPASFLDDLRARTTLSTLIAKTVSLKKAGREFKGCCPFHGEKTPSFYVNDDKAFYHCFGCSAHGDAITWMVDNQGLPFMEAVKDLAAAAGMEMPARDARHEEQDRERGELIAIMEQAARIFTANLQSDDVGIPGREYLRARGIDPYGVFKLGWACGGRQGPTIVEQLGGKRGEHVEKLVKLGLARVHTDGERAGQAFDFFRGRVMFPVRDARGRVIAFGGRVLGDQQPKYLNSPDTPLFDKGRTLFNVDLAAPAARKAGRIIVVEGYMDVVAMHRAGIAEAVAPNGTAVTEAQISTMWRLADVPILCFDGDAAGKKAAARAAIRALTVLEPGKSLSFVTPPAGQDPDDVLREGGAAAVEALFVKPRPLVDVLWQHELDAAPFDTPEQVAGLKGRMREHVRAIRNRDVREAYGQEIHQRLRRMFDPIAEGVVKQRVRPAVVRPDRTTDRKGFSPRATPQSAGSKAIGRGGMRQNLERAVIAGLLRYPEVAGRFAETATFARFGNNAAAEIRDLLVDAALANATAEFPERLEGAIAFAKSGTLRFSFTSESADPETAIADLVDALERLSH